jgi:hypothetical protein
MSWNEQKRGRDGGDGGCEEERMSVPRRLARIQLRVMPPFPSSF